MNLEIKTPATAAEIKVGDVVMFESHDVPVLVLAIELSVPEYDCKYTGANFGRQLIFDCTSDLDSTEPSTFYVRRERSGVTADRMGRGVVR
jgi:hypothetical protein